ncbi:DUF1015 family protein [Nocardioides gansuensis]|nr:DUF1015 family protein [Nocardioides gansuensis]
MDVDAVVAPPSVAKPLRLAPFRALTLSPGRVGDPASARAFARPYRAVAERLAGWQSRGHVSQDTAFGLYLHEYTVAGLSIRGLVGALDLSRRATRIEERAVWPHEGIHPGQVSELARRMAEMGMNPAPILLVHDGTPQIRAVVDEVGSGEPGWDFTDQAGQHHRIWAIRDPGQLDRVNEGLAATDALVADGHHRYAAYLALQEERPGTPWDRGLAMLVDQQDTPLFLGPIHRTLVGTPLAAVSAAAREAGARVRELPQHEALNALEPHTLVVTNGRSWAVLDLAGAPVELALGWLLDQLIPRLPTPPKRIDHHHSAEDAMSAASSKVTGVLLPATDYGQVRDIIGRGLLLPEKATSFQPKPSLGVLMRSVHDE